MAGWATHEGSAVVLDRDNIDTDQIIPARFMSAPRSAGYGAFLMHDLRRDDDGGLLADFSLNTSPEASILVAGAHFGSGSSREAAVYALVDAGFRAVIAPSFGDIFASNAVNNGLLPAQVSIGNLAAIMSLLSGTTQTLGINLHDCIISDAGHKFHFTLADNWRTKLINGWDDIDLTLQHAEAIAGFRTDHHSTQPWAWPRTAD